MLKYAVFSHISEAICIYFIKQQCISGMKKTFISASDFLKIIVQLNLKHYTIFTKIPLSLLPLAMKKY